MNVRYYHDFIGDDNVQNRFEILAPNIVTAKAVEATPVPFTLEYQTARKLDPVRGAQAAIGLISQSNFQFTDLHTDDMQGYQVKFYRSGKLYWLGWLDAELYNEQISATPPYPVEFSAADFNIWERLKYRDENEKRYTDIAPFTTHLKRCFDRLGLPFNKLYIGCSTTPNDVAMSGAETALHVLFMMSDNFYDEDNEPMSCREVVESILQPFGLMMVQKDANVYIYDYNTVKLGLSMKRYDFATLSYETDEAVNFNLGNMVEIGFRSTEGEYGFEEMINNVTITSSLYADSTIAEGEVDADNVNTEASKQEFETYKKEAFYKCDDIERVSEKEYNTFTVYTNKDDDKTIAGMKLFTRFTTDVIDPPLFRIKGKELLIGSVSKNFIRLKLDVYVNVQENPFETKTTIAPGKAEVCVLQCNLYTIDGSGKPLFYYDNSSKRNGWNKCENSSFQKGTTRLTFANQEIKGGNITDSWISNSNITIDELRDKNINSIKGKDYGKGLTIPITSNLYGVLVFEVVYRTYIMERTTMGASGDEYFSYNQSLPTKDILYNDIELSLVDSEGEILPTDDIEFKSYVNKKVKSDFDEITLKCISANEDRMPIGKANILKKVADHYEFQLSFTRSGQTEILERLLMRTIHSNFTTKNEKMTVDVKMTDNPALSYVSCNPILSGKYLVTCCTLDFHAGVTTISAVGYSEDTANLSSLPYD